MRRFSPSLALERKPHRKSFCQRGSFSRSKGITCILGIMKHQPKRTCIGCRSAMNKDEVVRIVAGPEGILIDYREKLPGRAAYICPREGCIVNALAKDTLARALRLRVRPPELNAFITQLTEVIKDKIRSLLLISMKAGKIAVGYSAVHDALAKERVQLLLCATD